MLSILKHRTVEKTVDRCELSIVEGGAEPQGAGSIPAEGVGGKEGGSAEVRA